LPSHKVKDRIPAVAHVDGTARIQSVQADTNPIFARLIGDFAKASSVPMVINISLNINEQPTVNPLLEGAAHLLLLGPRRALSSGRTGCRSPPHIEACLNGHAPVIGSCNLQAGHEKLDLRPVDLDW
jgi:hypothetical protein